MNSIQRALAFREGGQTQRVHTFPHNREYNVAVHCYNALTLLYTIYPGEPSTNLVKALLFHDTPERWTGDTPAPAKWASSELKEHLADLENKILKWLEVEHYFTQLTDREVEWLNAVDLLELYMWAHEQEAQGNTVAAKMISRIEQAFSERVNRTPIEVLKFIQNFTFERLPELSELKL